MAASIEKKIRRGLALTRFLQTIINPSVANKLLGIAMGRLRLGNDCLREKVKADGVSCEWIVPREARKDPVLIYLHGGGFVLGQTPPHMLMVARLARSMALRALMVDYRLAPAEPFPAALDDCVAVYRWALGQGFAPGNIVLAGDSAGGNLTLATLMSLRDGGSPLPAAAACLSPVTDLSPGRSPIDISKDPLLPPKAIKFYNRSYVGKADPRNPLISPVFGDLRGLPPLLIHAGEDELLREDAVRIAAVARAMGIEVELEIFPRMWHVWQLFLELPEALESLDKISRFLLSRLRG